jgi:lipid-A-disaccharide synthase-like uncharacterized protein
MTSQATILWYVSMLGGLMTILILTDMSDNIDDFTMK